MEIIDNKKYKITKSTCEVYKLRHECGMYWADITLDCGEKSGRIQIASDYGTWQNYWGCCGCSFKEFLTRLDVEYTAGKFRARNAEDREITPQFKRFWNEAWAVFIEQIKSEIK